MRKIFKVTLVAAWLCVLWVGVAPLPDVAPLAESIFVFLILWSWITGWATATIPARTWTAAPVVVRIILIASSVTVVVTALIVAALISHPGSLSLSQTRDVGLVLVLIAGVATPVCVITAYAHRSIAR